VTAAAPFVMLGAADAAACEGEACLVLPGAAPWPPATASDPQPTDRAATTATGPEAPGAPASEARPVRAPGGAS